MGFDPVSYLMGKEAGGGGNPNYVETITATLANPLGDSGYTIADMVALIASNAITMMVNVEASAIGFGDFSAYMYAFNNGQYNVLHMNGVSAAGESAEDWTVFAYTLVSGGADIAYVLSGGIVTDLSMYLGGVPTTLTIIHHPLPEGGDGA